MKKFIITIFTLFFLPISSFAKAHIDIAFTIDNNYPIFTLIAMDSILKYNNSDSDYTFWIVENNLTDKNKAKMAKYVKKKNQEIKFINVDTYKVDRGTDFYAETNWITKIAIARILLPDLLPQNIHKVLYLDSDILVNTDLLPLFETDISRYNAGMSPNIFSDNGAKELYEFKNGYYNSGVILMNLDKCRKDNSSQQMIDFLWDNVDKFRKDGNSDKLQWLYMDQDLINIVWDGKIKSLNQMWNNQCNESKFYNGCIMHYIASLKPWEFNRPNVFCVKDYYKYWLKSPFWYYYYYYRVVSFIKLLKGERINSEEISNKAGLFKE